MRKRIEVSWVRALFAYDAKTGVLAWAVPAGRYGRIRPGTEAGSVHADQRGYRSRYVSISGKLYKTTHLIWAWMTGKWPSKEIDHKNMDSLDDRWSNLREATDSEQRQNQKRRKDNTTGFKCVIYDRSRDKYRWQVRVNGETMKSGKRYKTAKEAHEAYCLVLPEVHGDFANGGSTS